MARKKNMNKVAIYTRTSSKTNMKGDSSRRQIQAGLAALKSSGVKPSKSLQKVTECISGMLPLNKKKKLQALLDGKTSHIFVESLRALGRKASGIEEIYEKAKETNTCIVVADLPPALFTASASPAENFQRRIMAAVQEFERDTIVNRLQQGLRAKAEQLAKAGMNPKKVNGRKSHLEKRMAQKGITKGQLKSLSTLCRARKRGDFGWRALAPKLSKILKLKKPMGKDAAMTLSKELKIA